MNFGQNLYNWFLSNAQSLVLLAIVVIGLYLGFKRELLQKCAIHDYELPFEVDEYTPISEINHLCEMVQELEGSPIYDELREIQGMWFSSLHLPW